MRSRLRLRHVTPPAWFLIAPAWTPFRGNSRIDSSSIELRVDIRCKHTDLKSNAQQSLRETSSLRDRDPGHNRAFGISYWADKLGIMSSI